MQPTTKHPDAREKKGFGTLRKNRSASKEKLRHIRSVKWPVQKLFVWNFSLIINLWDRTKEIILVNEVWRADKSWIMQSSSWKFQDLLPMRRYIEHSTNPGISKLVSTAPRVGVLDLMLVVQIECKLNFSDLFIIWRQCPTPWLGLLNIREL